MARGSVPLWVRCPRSETAWRVSTRRQAAQPGRATAVCPSCGHGLQLRETGLGMELIPPRNAAADQAHHLGQS